MYITQFIFCTLILLSVFTYTNNLSKKHYCDDIALNKMIHLSLQSTLSKSQKNFFNKIDLECFQLIKNTGQEEFKSFRTNSIAPQLKLNLALRGNISNEK